MVHDVGNHDINLVNRIVITHFLIFLPLCSCMFLMVLPVLQPYRWHFSLSFWYDESSVESAASKTTISQNSPQRESCRLLPTRCSPPPLPLQGIRAKPLASNWILAAAMSMMWTTYIRYTHWYSVRSSSLMLHWDIILPDSNYSYCFSSGTLTRKMTYHRKYLQNINSNYKMPEPYCWLKWWHSVPS